MAGSGRDSPHLHHAGGLEQALLAEHLARCVERLGDAVAVEEVGVAGE
jgi:hypothetical protein